MTPIDSGAAAVNASVIRERPGASVPHQTHTFIYKWRGNEHSTYNVHVHQASVIKTTKKPKKFFHLTIHKDV